jgi:hypothetical protein
MAGAVIWDNMPWMLGAVQSRMLLVVRSILINLLWNPSRGRKEI